MSPLIKRFSTLDELKSISLEEYKKFYDFKNINSVIEKDNRLFSLIKKDFLSAYEQLLLWEHIPQKSEFHYHIKYLLEEVRDMFDRTIPLNRFHEFIDMKFPTYKQALKLLIEGCEFFECDDKQILIEYLQGDKKVYITLFISCCTPQGFDYNKKFYFDTSLSDEALYGSMKDFVEDLNEKVLKGEYVLCVDIDQILEVPKN